MTETQQTDVPVADTVALARRVDGLEAVLTALNAKTDAQTIMIAKIEEAVTGVLASPRVKNALIAIWTTFWLAFTGWLAAKGFRVSP